MDGNGQMGRLWQSHILCRLHPVFEYLPVENKVLSEPTELLQNHQTKHTSHRLSYFYEVNAGRNSVSSQKAKG